MMLGGMPEQHTEEPHDARLDKDDKMEIVGWSVSIFVALIGLYAVWLGVRKKR